jgi:hypothetical protein
MEPRTTIPLPFVRAFYIVASSYKDKTRIKAMKGRKMADTGTMNMRRSHLLPAKPDVANLKIDPM